MNEENWELMMIPALHPASVSDQADSKMRPANLRALIAMERVKLLKRPMTTISIGLIAMLSAIVMGIGYLFARVSDEDATMATANLKEGILPGGIVTSLENTQLFARIVIVILAAILIGSEYSWGTIRVLVGSGVSRLKLLGAKLLVLAQASIALVLAGVLAGSLVSTATTILGGHALTLGGFGIDWIIDLALMLGRTTMVLYIMALIAATVALLARSVAGGITVGVVWTTLEPLIGRLLDGNGGVADRIHSVLISTNVEALTARNGFGPQQVPDHLPGAWQAAGVLLLYAIVLTLIAMQVFRARDITSAGG
jgi:ABC-2 type transport system permease protein